MVGVEQTEDSDYVLIGDVYVESATVADAIVLRWTDSTVYGNDFAEAENGLAADTAEWDKAVYLDHPQ